MKNSWIRRLKSIFGMYQTKMQILKTMENINTKFHRTYLKISKMKKKNMLNSNHMTPKTIKTTVIVLLSCLLNPLDLEKLKNPGPRPVASKLEGWIQRIPLKIIIPEKREDKLMIWQFSLNTRRILEVDVFYEKNLSLIKIFFGVAYENKCIFVISNLVVKFLNYVIIH